MRARFHGIAPLVSAVAVLGSCGGSPVPVVNPNAPPVPARAAGILAFETVRAVLQHPRCQNCHPAGDAPLQGDDGHVHAQNVQRGPDGHGMVGEECSTCHGPANPPSAYGLHVPPGNVKAWHMPSPDDKLVFVGLSAGSLCERIKDPAQNGGKDMAAFLARRTGPCRCRLRPRWGYL